MAESQSRETLPPQLLELLWVALGAVPGAWLRWQAAEFALAGGGNVLVNVAGAFLLALLVGRGVGSRVQLLLGVGFCGSLTTFSSWMVDSVVLIAAGHWAQATGLLGLTLGLGLGFGALGLLLGRRLRPSAPPRLPR